MLKIMFIIISLLAASTIVIGKLFIFGRQKPVIVGNYAASVGAILGLYSILAIAMMTQGGYLDKLVMLIFALSPYLIGKIVTYRSIKLFTLMQIILLILSALFVIYCVD